MLISRGQAHTAGPSVAEGQRPLVGESHERCRAFELRALDQIALFDQGDKAERDE